MNTKHHHSGNLIFALVLANATSGAMAAPQPWDQFIIGPAYSAANLETQGSTVGGWIPNAWEKPFGVDAHINPIGLAYPGLSTDGGCASAPDFVRSGHRLTTPYTNATTETVYFSLLMKLDSDDGAAYRCLEMHSGGFDDGANRKLQLGQSNGAFGNNNYGLQLFNFNGLRLDLGGADTKVNLFVLKFVFGANNDEDSLTVWRNPSSSSFGGAEPAGGATLSNFNLEIDRTTLAHFSGGEGVSFDEFRLGSTWADVTPASNVTPPDHLVYTFDDGTLQGWTDLTLPNLNVGPRNWASSPAAFPFVAQGSHAIGQNVVGGTEDSGHPALWLTSPRFHLNGTGDLTLWLRGGHGNGADITNKYFFNMPADAFDDPTNPTFPSFLGVALRDAVTGQFVLAGTRTGPGNDWQKVTFTAAQLAALDQSNAYTLDLIDLRSGTWGWVAMDSVTIPGTFEYFDWIASKGLTGVDSEFESDPDFDGITNGMEFVLGGEPNPANPNSESSALLPTMTISSGNLVFTYNRTDASAYLGPIVQFSEDPSNFWTDAADPGNATISVVDSSPSDTVTVSIPIGSFTRLFARLRVALPIINT